MPWTAPIVVAPSLSAALKLGSPSGLAAWLEQVPRPQERENQISRLASGELSALGAALDVRNSEELFSTLDPHAAAELLTRLGNPAAERAITAINSDLAVDILRECSPADRERLLSAIAAGRSAVLRGLLEWPERSVAAHMVPEVLTVSPSLTAGEAIEAVRSHPAQVRSDSQTGAYVFVTDGDERLVGVVAFRALVLADASTTVARLMDDDVIAVAPLDDPEEAARTLLDQRLLALPVVDADDRLIGILPADAAADIADDQATEDAELQGGSQPLDVPYLRATPWLLWRKRIVWLLVLFVAEAYTGTVLRAFEDELEAVVSLAFFIPLLIGTGGNTGTQITTTLVRAVATGQVGLRDLGRVLIKELSAAGLISLGMAAAGLVRAYTLGVGWEVMLVVSITLAAIVVWASLIAAVLPLLLSKTRIDPAVVSAPMIATVVDGTGLLIYFLIAKALLPELAGL